MSLYYSLAIILILFFTGLKTSKAAEWGYWGENGPERWPEICATGKQQSPIDIVTKNLVTRDFDSLEFDQYDVAVSTTMINNGHSVQIGFGKLDIPISLRGGNLPSTYILEQMHFHWDAEHTINNIRDPLELHLVHYNTKFGNFSNAARSKNGLVVIGVLFKVDHSDNPIMKPIVDAANLVSKWVGKSEVPLQKLIPITFLPEDRSSYYRYQGSLTTPTCDESVIWIVLADKVPISEKQLSVFKKVESPNGPLKFNYRPTQKVGNRSVYHRQGGKNEDSASSSKSNILFTLLNLLLVRLLNV